MMNFIFSILAYVFALILLLKVIWNFIVPYRAQAAANQAQPTGEWVPLMPHIEIMSLIGFGVMSVVADLHIGPIEHWVMILIAALLILFSYIHLILVLKCIFKWNIKL